MMRIILFLATNIAVLVVVGVIMSIFGIGGNPNNVMGLLVMCALFGMIGSMVSLFLSKPMAKRATGTQLITEPQNQHERWLLDTVKRQAERSGIDMPEVGIFPSPQPNAFATGWNKNKALVAVSTELLRQMSQEEVEAVLGHEIGHVANGDMVTLALIQGVVNTFVMFFARIVGNIIDQTVFKNENGGSGIGYFMTVMVLQVVFGILASAVVAWFSRYREYRADEAGARLAGKQSMINALERLKPASQQPDEMPEQMQALAISEGKSKGFNLKALFSTHPPLDDRIAALQKYSGAH